MVRVAIVEDETCERNVLRGYFTQLAQEMKESVQLDEYASGDELLNKFTPGVYDLLCLDIEMPGRNGMETAMEIRTIDEQVVIVFVTNLAQLAIQGYAVQALDFILKPISYYPFAMKLRRAFQIIRTRQVEMLTVQTPGGFYRFSSEELYYVEVRTHYCFFHTLQGEFREKSSLKEVESRLARCPFARCHQAFLVNLRHVIAVNGDEILVGDQWLHVSRAKKREFFAILTDYLGGVST